MTMPLRFPLLALVCLAVSAFAAETPAPTWPLWDGHESIERCDGSGRVAFSTAADRSFVPICG